MPISAFAARPSAFASTSTTSASAWDSLLGTLSNSATALVGAYTQAELNRINPSQTPQIVIAGGGTGGAGTGGGTGMGLGTVLIGGIVLVVAVLVLKSRRAD